VIRNSNKPKGFSLIEMIVVVMITLLILTLGINTYRDQQRHVIYNESVSKVLSIVKVARNHALTNRPIFDEDQQLSIIPKNGYGVYFERSETPGESKVILFANTVAETEVEQQQFDPGEHIEETYTIPSQVEFVGLWADQNLPDHTGIGGGTPDQAALFFNLPLENGLIAVNDNPAPDSLTTLTDLYLEFRLADSDAEIPSQYIHINSLSGLAEINRL